MNMPTARLVMLVSRTCVVVAVTAAEIVVCVMIVLLYRPRTQTPSFAG